MGDEAVLDEHENMKKDIRLHFKGEKEEEIFPIFRDEFRKYYKLPFHQRIIGSFYGTNGLVILANGFFQMRNQKKDRDHLEIIERLHGFRSDLNLNTYNEPRILVRVDDYPRWDTDMARFERFHGIMAECGIPYLLGVTPYLCDNPLDPGTTGGDYLSDDELVILGRGLDDGWAAALHGIKHRTGSGKLHTESIGVKPGKLSEEIQEATERMRKDGIICDFYIPPFNTVDMKNIEVLSRYFKGICGGPETVATLGYRISPTHLGDTLYIPSYTPLYEKTANIIPVLKNIPGNLGDGIIVPFTLHWNWETGNDFQNLRKFVRRIRGSVIRWDSFSGQS